MFKRILTLTLFLFAICSVCFARPLPETEFRVGGIGVSYRLGEVKRLYGEPTRRVPFDGGMFRGVAYEYGNALVVYCAKGNVPNEDSFSVTGLKCATDKLATPSGYRVGQSIQDVFAGYGPVEARNYNGYKAYTYGLQPALTVELEFLVDQSGRIVMISVLSNY